MNADQTAREAAALLRDVLAAVERGELDAGSPRAKALVRRIEGAMAGLETRAATSERASTEEPDSPSAGH